MHRISTGSHVVDDLAEPPQSKNQYSQTDGQERQQKVEAWMFGDGRISLYAYRSEAIGTDRASWRRMKSIHKTECGY